MKKKDVIKVLCRSLNSEDLLKIIDGADFIYEKLEDDFTVTSKDEKELVENIAEMSVILKGIAARLDIVNKVDKAEEELILEIISVNVSDTTNDNDFDNSNFEDEDFDMDEFENFDDFDEFDGNDEFDESEDEDEDSLYESWMDTDDIEDNDVTEGTDDEDGDTEVTEDKDSNEDKDVSADDFLVAFEAFNNGDEM